MAKKKSRQVRLINKFVKIFFLFFTIFVVLAALGTMGYIQVASSNILKQLTKSPVVAQKDGEGIDEVLTDEEASNLNSKKITTVAVFGVDNAGYRTDVNMIVFFHHETGDIDIVSVPRDTKVRIPDDIFAEINETRSGVKQNTRINSIPAYVNPKRRNDVSVTVLESVFGVNIDYYVNMDLNGFKYIVDAVGPIPVEVPMDMTYTDLSQEPNLIINLKAGHQELNGSQAEELIRYRYGYANADIGRIETQHIFMKAFMEKLLEPDNRINIVSILETVLVHVTTNFTDAVDYMIYLDKLSADRITMTTLPGAGSKTDGTYEYDPAATKELFESILNKDYKGDSVDLEKDKSGEQEGTDTGEPSSNANGSINDTNDSGSNDKESGIQVTPVEPVDVSMFSIIVQNGTYVTGLAGRTKERLIEAGFNVVGAENYELRPLEKTIIKAANRDIGEAIAVYFNKPDIFVDESLEDEEAQVIIAIGTSDSDAEENNAD